MNKRITQLKSILWIIVSFGLVAIIARIFGGLGASTNLSDSMPWGLWKILNMVAGAALATGGFTLAAVVHVFKIENLFSNRWKPLDYNHTLQKNQFICLFYFFLTIRATIADVTAPMSRAPIVL